jgi:DNA repair exonuclease SbcCD ATPase subunit
MDGQVYLKETKGMTKGFEKQGVLSYIEAKDKEIAQLKKNIRELEETPITSSDVDVAKYEKEIADLKDERVRLNQHLAQIEEQLTAAIDKQNVTSTPIDEAKFKATEAKNIELSQKLIELSGKDADLTTEIKKLRGEIVELKNQNEELKSKADSGGGFAPQYDMSGIFAQAQATAVEITKKAQEAADNMIRDAKSQSDIMISEAEEEVARIKNSMPSPEEIEAAKSAVANTQSAEESSAQKAAAEKAAQEVAAEKQAAEELMNKIRMAQLETQRVIKEATERLLELNDRLVDSDLLDGDEDESDEETGNVTPLPAQPKPSPHVSAPPPAQPKPSPHVSAPQPSSRVSPPSPPKPAPKMMDFGINMDDLLKSVEANPDDMGDVPLNLNDSDN